MSQKLSAIIDSCENDFPLKYAKLKAGQSSNECRPMFCTFFGTSMLSKFEQLLNANFPTVVKQLGNVTELKLVQWLNDLEFMQETLSGNDTAVKLG